jgi:predicted transcriptional regulator
MSLKILEEKKIPIARAAYSVNIRSKITQNLVVE